MVFDGFTGAIGSLALAKFLPQTIYNRHADDDAPPPADAGGSSSSGSGDDCDGRACFGASFAIIAALSCTAAAAAGILHCRNRRVYKNIIAVRRRARSRAA